MQPYNYVHNQKLKNETMIEFMKEMKVCEIRHTLKTIAFHPISTAML